MQIVTPLLCALACLAGLQSTAALAETRRLELPASPTSGVIYNIGGGPEGLTPEDAIKAYIGAPGQCCEGKSPIVGTYLREGAAITFEPLFEFLEGQTYTVETWTGELTDFVIAPVAVQANPGVLAIYPSGGVVPENTLRFYIQFSGPMKPHQAEDFIALIDPNGVEDREAFMSFKQELWNAERTRLTLLMDPGRIKRGVAQNLRLGPALLEGQQHAIAIRAGWPAANGQSAADRFEKSFVVGPPLRSLPSTSDWQISLPKAGSLEPISISFDRPFDRFQTAESLTLQQGDGNLVSGAAWVEPGEMVWRFAPDQPWPTGRLELLVDARLEDVSGNNFRDTLDHALGTDVRDIDQIAIPLWIAEP